LLDDLKFIAQRDKSDAFGVTARQAQELLYKDFDLDGVSNQKPTNVVFSGMGGSALAAVICQRWLKAWMCVPFEIVRDYHIPGYVDDQTLFIASSYSGNTEETVASLHEAMDRGAEIIVMASGGKLKAIAEQNNLKFIHVPGGIQPRMATLYMVRILGAIFDHTNLTDSAVEQIESISDWLADEAKELEPQIGTSVNLAKQIAENIVGKTGVVYSGPMLSPAAYKWKISLNESSKNLAWSNEFSEFNHNEFLGWTSHPIEKVFAVVELQSSFDHPQIQKRFEISNRLLSGKMPAPMIIQAKGDSHLAQILWAVQLGDFVSLYLAMLNNVDPTPVEIIEKLKLELI
jgi:glucose/mannose-6-phosphate isomerase